MPVEDVTFPQNGDQDFAQYFAALSGISNNLDYVETGMSVSLDAGVPEATITDGKAFIGESQNTISSNSQTQLLLGYAVHKAGETVSLTDNTTNYIYLVGNVGSNDSATYSVNTTGSSPQADSILIATVDTSGDTVSEENRYPKGEFRDVDVYGDVELTGTITEGASL